MSEEPLLLHFNRYPIEMQGLPAGYSWAGFYLLLQGEAWVESRDKYVKVLSLLTRSEGHQNSQRLGVFVAIKQILTPHPDVTWHIK